MSLLLDGGKESDYANDYKEVILITNNGASHTVDCVGRSSYQDFELSWTRDSNEVIFTF